MADETCVWEEDDMGNWSTACGDYFNFADGPPSANRFKYCPYCKAALIERPYQEEPDGDEG